MSFCLPKHLVDDFVGKLKSGEINPQKLSKMTSAERNAYFTTFLGKDNAHKVNADFESKLLLKNQKQGIINWAKHAAGIKKDVQRDLISRAERMTEILKPETEDAFLGDLVERRLGIGVTVEEAGKIADLAKTAADNKAKIKEDSPIRSSDRIDYGAATFAFKEYVKALKQEVDASTPRGVVESAWTIVKNVSGGFKVMAASMDASFSLRQGYMTLFTKPKVWADVFLDSFSTWERSLLQGLDGTALIKADVFSRPNAINGNYAKMKLDIGLEYEEAFPRSWPTKIPILGKLYKASGEAYNGALLRMRADLADIFIENALSAGIVDFKDSGIGLMVNSMTGRGRVGLTQEQADATNVALFSVRHFKAQVDTLSGGLWDKKSRGTYGQKQAANNILRVVGIVGSTLLLAKMLDPDSVDFDPRSGKFGKVGIKVGNKRVWVDLTAGRRSIIILLARVVPTMRRGEWGQWWQSSNGNWHNMWDKEYGSMSATDFIVNFFQNKAAPLARAGLNAWKQETWDGSDPTFKGELFELVSPISISNAYETIEETKDENLFWMLILSGLNMLGGGTTHKKKKRSIND